MASDAKRVHDDPEAEAVQPPGRASLAAVDVSLRVVLFAATASALAMTVTSDQVKVVASPFFASSGGLALEAKFTYSSAIIYSLVAVSVVCVYSVLTGIASISSPSPSSKRLIFLAAMDAVMVGVTASAGGALASLGYIAYNGNRHIHWQKVCDVFDKFCRHAVSSALMSLVASLVLIALVLLSALSLHRRRPTNCA